MGIRQTGIPVGGAIAAALFPAVALAAGWRAAIAVGGVLCFAAAAACWFGYHNPPVPTAAQSAADASPPAPRALHYIVLTGLAGGLLTLGQFTLLTYLALYLKETQDVPLGVSASLLVAAQIAGAAGRILWGVWSDRLFGGRRKPALILANLLAALGALVIGWLPLHTPLWLIAPLVVVYAFNTLGWHGNWVALLVEIGGSARQGRTVSQGMSIMYPGIIVLPPLFGWFVDRTHSWSGAWSLLSLVMLLGILLLLRVPERPRAF